MNSMMFYKIMAKCYDLLDFIYFRDYQHSPRKASLESINSKDRVLDICTGTATTVIRIAKQHSNAEIMGIDISDAMLKIAENKLCKEHIKNVELFYMNATDMTFEKDCFDKVLISLVLHEMDDILAEKLLREAVRVLKKEGRIIVTEWEPSKVLWRKLLFLPIHILEPKTYRSFVKKDLYQYFRSFDLEVEKEIHCNYSRVLILKKNENDGTMERLML